jgi:hypothetical protein
VSSQFDVAPGFFSLPCFLHSPCNPCHFDVQALRAEVDLGASLRAHDVAAAVKHSRPLTTHDLDLHHGSHLHGDGGSANKMRSSSAGTSQRKKDKLERLREKEREFERERDEYQRELQAQYRHSITAAAASVGAATKSSHPSHTHSRHPTMLSASTANLSQAAITALTHSGLFTSTGSKPSSPSDHKPFVVKHVPTSEATASVGPHPKQASPPTNMRSTSGASAVTGAAASGVSSTNNSRHSSPSGISSHLYSSANVSNATASTTQAVTGVGNSAAGISGARGPSRLSASLGAGAAAPTAGNKPIPTRFPSPTYSRQQPAPTPVSVSSAASGSAPPTWQSATGSDSANLLSHRSNIHTYAATRTSSRSKF